MKITRRIRQRIYFLLKREEVSPSIVNKEIVTDEVIENEKIIDAKEKHADLICRSLLSGAGAIEIIRDSLLLSSQSLMKELATIEELTHKNEVARQKMEQLLQLVGIIEQHSGESRGHIAELLIILKGIHENIDGINRLSQQTNLVAINSAIESAHIGIKAAGFSIISKEIRRLSSDIQCQSKNINTLTDEISQQAKHVSSSIDQNNQAILSIHTATKQSCELLLEVIESSTYMSGVIRFIATQQFLNTVKLDYIIWKIKVYELILQEDMDSAINSHTECRLGGWYYGELGRGFSHYNGFKQLEEPHAKVHHSGKGALAAYRQGDDESLKANLAAMEQASVLVIKYIDELLTEWQYSLLEK